MAYTPRNSDANDRYEFRSDQPTVSKLVRATHDTYAANGHSVDRSYTPTRRSDDGSRQTRDSGYEGIKRSHGDQYSIQQLAGADHRQTNERRTGDYVQRVPTNHTIVDSSRRPGEGNGRGYVMEINIAVSLGGDRGPQASVISTNVSPKQPAIRSTATIDDVRYIDLHFQGTKNTAQLATDGVIRRPTSRFYVYPLSNPEK